MTLSAAIIDDTQMNLTVFRHLVDKIGALIRPRVLSPDRMEIVEGVRPMPTRPSSW